MIIICADFIDVFIGSVRDGVLESNNYILSKMLFVPFHCLCWKQCTWYDIIHSDSLNIFVIVIVTHLSDRVPLYSYPDTYTQMIADCPDM